METGQMIPLFSFTFSTAMFVILISEFENTQNSFSCGPSFGLLWSVKYLNIWPKATDWGSSSYFFRKQAPSSY